MNSHRIGWPSRAARTGTGLVAVAAAALSFRATSAVAESSGAVRHGWGWLVPVVVEAGVLVSAALMWVRAGAGDTTRAEATVMAGLLLVSVVVNVAHAAGGTLLGRALAGLPPIVLLCAIEGLMREQRRAARVLNAEREREERAASRAVASAQRMRTTTTSVRAATPTARAADSAVSAPSTRTARKDRMALIGRMVEQCGGIAAVTGEIVASKADTRITASTGRRWLKEYRAEHGGEQTDRAA